MSGAQSGFPYLRASADAGSGGSAPLVFVSDLKVNTDGTRISYKVDDPRAQHGAINDIRNALRSGHSIAEFQALAAANWEPVDKTWQVVSASVIEKNKSTGKPCVSTDGFLVSKTADVSVAGGFDRDGDCDQTKWLDALKIPALVLPGGSQFQTRKATTRSIVVAMTVAAPHRLAFGIVGDTGPTDEIGEASVAMNRALNGLPETAVPSSGRDAIARFQAPRSVVMVFPGQANRVPYPITPERVASLAKARFDTWGGESRLTGCLAEVGAAQ